jgi:hypothetical protein
LDIYVVGASTTKNYVNVATYWKNGVGHLLADSLGHSLAYAVCASGNDVYIAGYTSAGAVYWKNSIMTVLSPNASATSICTDGNDIYFGGYVIQNYNSYPAYWKDGTLNMVSTTTQGAVNSIVVSGGTLYLGGYVTSSTTAQKAVYWINGVQQDLTSGGFPARVNGIDVDGGNVYATGVWESGSGTDVATDWRDKTHTALSDTTVEANASAIKVIGGDIYVTGYFNTQGAAVYWRNGYMNTLSTNYFEATGIAVNGTDLYISGFKFTPGEPAILAGATACFWKNGTLIQLPPGDDGSAMAYGIAVVPK